MGRDGGGLIAKTCSSLVTPWTAACQAPLSIGFARQEYWNGLPFPSTGHLPNLGIKPRSPALHADSLPTEESPVSITSPFTHLKGAWKN